MADTQATEQGPGRRGPIEAWADFVRGPPGIIAGIMALLALIGTGITLANASWARTYWLILVPIYAALCAYTAWHRTGQFGGTVMRQILHWLAVAAAIALDFAFLQSSGGQAATATGLNSLLILALGCVLAGIHLEWLFALVGLLLAAIFMVVTLAQEYLLMAFLIGLAVVVIFFAAQWIMRRRLA
jgi:hypothetical protein